MVNEEFDFLSIKIFHKWFAKATLRLGKPRDCFGAWVWATAKQGQIEVPGVGKT